MLRMISIQLIKHDLSINSGSGSECSLSRLAKSKNAEFTSVIEHFFDERNAESGHYGQTLFSCVLISVP